MCFCLGRANLKPEKSVKMIRSAIESFQLTNPKYLTTIKLIIYESKLMPIFQTLTQARDQTKAQIAKSQQSPYPKTTPSASLQHPSHVALPDKSHAQKRERNVMMLKFCSKSDYVNNEVSFVEM